MKIAIGISGGVDSAVSALLLKEQGHDVFGLFMQNWVEDSTNPQCTAEQDLSDARAVCDKIGIPLQTVTFAQEYWDQVFQHCLDEFAKGRTPNPDVLCNREIKFNLLLQHALDLGADALATGHYVRRGDPAVKPRDDSTDKSRDDSVSSFRTPIRNPQLLKGLDQNKDQSYFLYMIKQEALAKSLFPIGELEKPAVRAIAEKAGLINANKKDSTGICFIGERRFKEFLSEFILAQPGKMKTPDGEIVGDHDGIMFYTIGQRKGLNIGGLKQFDESPWYVVDKEVESNVLIVAQGEKHPLLYKPGLVCEELTWIAGQAPGERFSCAAKTRYRQCDQLCQVTKLADDRYQVDFELPQRAVTPGQSVVFYDGDVCLGGGIIV